PESARESTVRTVAGLTTGLKVSSKSTPRRWVKPRRTQRALYRSRVPSAWNLCLKIHLPVTTLARGGRGTRSQVLFASRASCSASIAARQLGSARALWKIFGIGDRGAAWKSFGWRKPDFALVVMPCWFTMGGTGTAPLGKGGGGPAGAAV